MYILPSVARLLHDREDWAASLSLAAGLQHLSDAFPDPLQGIQERLKSAVSEASAHLGAQQSEAILLEARTTDFDALLDTALRLL